VNPVGALEVVGRASSLSEPKKQISSRCEPLMDSEGNRGEWGDALHGIMSSPPYVSAFTNPTPIQSLCPQASKMNQEEILNFWVWLWTALAQEESSCRLNQHHATHASGRRINHREGHGLWTMEKSKIIRRSRGPACAKIEDFEGQALCSVDIMFKTQLDRARPITWSGSYWGPLRRYKKQMKPHMARFKRCFD
jgi:hypothetical protein